MARDWLTTLVMVGRTVSIHSFNKRPGIGSSSLDLKDMAEIKVIRLLDVALENEFSSQSQFIGTSVVKDGVPVSN